MTGNFPATGAVRPAPPTAPPGPGAGPGPGAAAALVAPITPGTRSVQPEAQTPQATKLRPPTVKAAPPTRRLRPGDLVCGECGEGNPPMRKFCSRCGHSLQTATTVATPWYRKLLPRRQAKTLAAGERPGRAGTPGKRRGGRSPFARVFAKVRMGVALAVLLGGIVYGALPQVRAAVNARVQPVQKKVHDMIFPSYDPVSAVKATGTSQTTGHEAAKAVDGFKNTYWMARKDQRSTLVLTFDGTVDLDRMLLRSGASDDFKGENRPRVLHLVYSTGKTADVAVKDTPDVQELKLTGGHHVTSVEIHIDQVYESLQGHFTAISEIELFAKK